MERDLLEDSGELALISRSAGGDSDAFRKLVESYERELLNYLRRLLGDAESARDIAQETFIAAYQALPTWRPPWQIRDKTPTASNALVRSQGHQLHRPLAPWLYRIATNRALSELKRRRMHTRRSDQDMTIAMLQTARWTSLASIEPVTNPEETYVLREILYEALCRLSEEDATCIVLRFVQGKRYADIAQLLGITSVAVRKRVARGIVVMREAIQKADAGEDS